MTFEELIEHFPGGKHTPRGEYVTHCLAHDDRKASLGIRIGRRGGIVMKCQAGCATHKILAKAGLTLRDLAPPSANGVGMNGAQPPPEFVASYRYDDAAGHHVATKHRKPDKRFVWQQANGEWNLKGVTLPLFGLPELLKSEPGGLICIAEGEKDVLSLRKRGQIATTNAHGASKGDTPKWTQADTDWLKQHLADRQFLIFADFDEAGIKHADVIYHSLKKAGLSVRQAQLPGLAKGEDISDWLPRHTEADLQAVLKEPEPADRLLEAGIRIIRDDVLAEAVLPDPIFVIDGILPVGYTLLASKPKIGKTRGITGLAEAVARGGKAMGKIDVTQGEVLFLAMESDLQDVQSRLESIRNGERPSGMLYVTTAWPNAAGGGLDLLEEWLSSHPAALLVILDTIAKLKPPAKRGADLYAEDYAFGANLKRIADEHQVALLGLHHQRKAGSEDRFDTMSGTLGMTAPCDALWVLERTRGQADAVISMTGRKIKEQDIAVKQDEHIGTWLYLGDADEFRRSKERRDVLRVLQASDTPLSPAEIADELQKKGPAVRQLLGRMVSAREITRTDKGRYTVWQGF